MITPEIHLFPFRTEKLSLVVPMVLPFGERVGNHLFFFFILKHIVIPNLLLSLVRIRNLFFDYIDKGKCVFHRMLQEHKRSSPLCHMHGVKIFTLAELYL